MTFRYALGSVSPPTRGLNNAPVKAGRHHLGRFRASEALTCLGVPCSGSAPGVRGASRIDEVGTGTHGGGLVDHAVEPVDHYSVPHF